MIRNFIIFSGLLLLVGCSELFEAYEPVEEEGEQITSIQSKADLANEQQQLSYALGVLFGRQIRLFEDLDQDLLMFGLNQGYTDEEVVLTDQEMSEIIVSQQQLAVRRASESALIAGQAFLAENAKKEGVVILDSGIQYRVLVEGEGEKPTLEDTIEVHYEGTLVDGKVFDSSYLRNQTAVFPTDGVIQGWQEVLPLMSVGSRWEVVIPPELAYGEAGAGQIGPNEVLIFDIDLIGIQN